MTHVEEGRVKTVSGGVFIVVSSTVSTAALKEKPGLIHFILQNRWQTDHDTWIYGAPPICFIHLGGPYSSACSRTIKAAASVSIIGERRMDGMGQTSGKSFISTQQLVVSSTGKSRTVATVGR